ncbi:hypothetical protein AURANDRAFT_70708 [Aureococcus anophagefferens]|uniref:Aminotransferase class I/classII large domain-containing protein n=1 Tax=Aureococcus anophagefferens TaxID=44056 RepID=F0XXN2_AURAN|nr:hypothetical protein AURANDRAFT_70708 [Aureococcus anophagefferens]EGB12321.1 hypothetical protein AURANDRAFT_70708 [Aureococcus anophagefferens]|eukprot:XP_009033372.1 hypothetical protein AURANDRAFT_70708 [Aureococcus anophagefferens]
MAVAPRPPAPAAAAGAAAAPPRGQRVSSYLWRAVAAFLAGDAAALRAAACACDALRRATARDDLWARALAALGALHAGRGGARARAVRAAAFRAPRAVGVASSRARGAHGRAVGAARAALAVDAPPAPTGAALGLDGRGRLAFWRPRPARRRRTPAAWRRFAGAVDRGGAGAPRPAPETAGFVQPTRLSWPRRVAGLAANAGPGVAAVVFGEVDGDGPEPRAEFRGLAVGPVVCGSYGFTRGRKRVRNSQLQRLLSRSFSTRFTDAPLCDGRCLGAFALHGASGALGGGDDFEAAVLEGGEAARGTLAGAAHVQRRDPWRPAVRGAYDADAPAPARVDPADADAVGHWARATLALDTRGPPRGCVDAPSARVRRVAAVLTVEANGADPEFLDVFCGAAGWAFELEGTLRRSPDDAAGAWLALEGRAARRGAAPKLAPGGACRGAYDALAGAGWPPAAAAEGDALLVEGELRGGVLAAVLRLHTGRVGFVDGALAAGLVEVDAASFEELPAAPRAMIDLRKGHPRLEELPHGAVSRACAAAAADLAARGEAGLPLNYGPARGQRSHLAALAGWLAARYGSRVDRSWLMTTNGVSHGLELCAAALTRPGDEILVEAPTYFLAAAIFRDHGLKIRGVAVDAAGEDAAYAALGDGPAPPDDGGGDDYDPAAAATGAGAPAAPAAAGAPRGRVVSVGSFTKILSPGLRVGWVEAAPDVVAALAARGYVDSGGGVAPLASEIATRVVASGDLDAHLDGARAAYAARCAALLAELDAAADVFEPLARPTGGFFVWVRLKRGLSAKTLLARASRDVVFLPGGACDPGGAPPLGAAAPDLDAHVRLCFAMQSEADVVAGARALAGHARALADEA